MDYDPSITTYTSHAQEGLPVHGILIVMVQWYANSIKSVERITNASTSQQLLSLSHLEEYETVYTYQCWTLTLAYPFIS